MVCCVLDLVCNSCAWTNNKNTARRHTLCVHDTLANRNVHTHTAKSGSVFAEDDTGQPSTRARARVRFFFGAAQHAGTPGRPREPHTKFSLCVPARSADDRDHMHLR